VGLTIEGGGGGAWSQNPVRMMMCGGQRQRGSIPVAWGRQGGESPMESEKWAATVGRSPKRGSLQRR
jgi:hypothetical protein